ncbi:MAG: ABC transporter substrate-binding protein [Oscillospiraceae bacterium]|jgi:ABC-type glycerol-3-phosphate transport system substrate-binding protein|nr:ABC transporter substrate-binding protein [Oscillospiraceae bacterium]
MKSRKRLLTVLLTLIIILQVSACRNIVNDDFDENNIGSINVQDDFDIEKHIYLSHEIDTNGLDGIMNPISGAIAYGDYIVCWYHEYEDITILKLSSDGNTEYETHLLELENLYEVKALSIKDDGHYAIIATTSVANDEITINYLLYDEQGVEIEKVELITIPQYFSTFTQIQHAIIANDNIVVVTVTGSHYTIHLLTTSGEKLGEMYTTNLKDVVRLRDNRVVALFNEGSSSSLREIDFTTSSWSETHHFEIKGVEKLIPADTTHSYDFLINTNEYLIGYVLETETQIPLINWLESNTLVTWQSHIGMLPNKDIFVLHSRNTQAINNSAVLTNLTVFVRSVRSETDQRKIITIGGMNVHPHLRLEVAQFNSENPDYRIEIKEYTYNNDLSYEANLMRFNVELMTGRGPDIIADAIFSESTSVMADLYTFIDADPVINRADFFQNALHALEKSDGTLPVIANSFIINTMIAKPETAELLTPFTFETLLFNFDESNPYSLAGQRLTGSFFIGRALSNSESFIDWDNNQANINNDEFINMLEIAAQLPSNLPNTILDIDNEQRKFRNAEQLLLPLTVRDIGMFRHAKAELGEFVVMGEPTFTGGHSIVHVMGSLGIYSLSQNQDAAWSFIRRLLLPNATLNANMELPIRIDIFEKQIAALMVKEYWEEDVPALGIVAGEEKPISYAGSNGNIPIFAMTEEEAQEIRFIINSAVVGSRSDITVTAIINEEFQNFINGLRSSADTARIIQNRVQTYLNEKG